MLILKYSKDKHKDIIHVVVLALQNGKVVAFPTDTSYGLAVDVTNSKAVSRLYKIKERIKSQPVHIVVSSIAQAKTLVEWPTSARNLARAFWPGGLSLILPIKTKSKHIVQLSAKTGFLGLRITNNFIAQELVKSLKNPITATSANPSAHISGGYDSYSAEDILKQFAKQTHKPDIIIDIGKLPKTKPSTMVKITKDGSWQILRAGPVTRKQIENCFS